eukprot:TRINITY_DN111107_c0_g1_i1.p1 TRINITY_DN111107_c0_g1~~TRINITY_DN111107_c0_g1_i1.p1  ORF type:complete len:641 (-),score=152.53 TRINITY_DN111107_c0_g1_i1:106-2028(-)
MLLRYAPRPVGQVASPPVAAECWQKQQSRRQSESWASSGRLWTSVSSTACAAVLVTRSRRQHRHSRCFRRATAWQVVNSGKGDLDDAVADLAQAVMSATSAGLSFALLSVPPQWAGEISLACEALKSKCAILQTVPLIGMQSGGATGLQLALACGGSAQPFFVNKEDLSLAGGGLAKSASADVPGVPLGTHGSFLLFADPLVPATLTRNLLEALDGGYPASLKAGLVVLPAKSKGSSDADEDDWEPPKDGSRQLRPRNRDDGHGWLSGDPAFRSTDESTQTAGPTVEFKRRPFGVKRYCPGMGGTGAMVLDMFEKARYPGDALGQCAVSGVTLGMIVKSINGQDVRSWDFEDIMDVLNDEGVVDPDSKSAASWGSAKDLDKRQPKEPAALPVTVEFAGYRSAASAGSAPLSLNGTARRDGVVGLALSDGGASALDLEGCTRVGPVLKVKGTSKESGGAFCINTVELNGKDLPAAGALKMAAKAAGLSNMKGMSVGMPRPQGAASPGGNLAADWSLFPILSVTKEGGLVLRCKGPTEEGLGSDEALASIQLFCPKEGGATLQGLASSLGQPGYASIAFATRPEALAGAPEGVLGIVGAAVIGAAGVKTSQGTSGASSSNVFNAATTKLHRQAAANVMLRQA